jgi:mercuric ion binding protein
VALFILPLAAFADGHVYRLRVDGLACPFCAYGVEKKLSGVNGVEKLTLDIDAGLVTVTMAPGAALDEAVARKAISAAGFTLRGFERTKGP